MIGTTTGIERGCGYREQGGAYLETGLDEEGAPVEAFLIDPPKAFEPDAKIGQEIVEIDGTAHVLDWIGSQHYLYTADFVEEVRRYGVSRRMSRNFDLDRLTTESRLILIHARARFEGHAEDQEFVETHGDGLPSRHCAFYEQQGEEAHLDFPTGACTRKWWWDAEPNAEKYTRKVASFEYGPVLGAEMPDPVPAIFASFPISNVAVIQANDGGHKEVAQDLADRSPEIPVVVTTA